MYADHQPQAVDETRKHERFRDFPDTEEVGLMQGSGRTVPVTCPIGELEPVLGGYSRTIEYGR